MIDRTGSGVPERQPLWQAMLTSNLLGKAVWPDAKYAEHYGKAARLWLLTCHLLVSYAIGDFFANLGSLAEEYPGQEEGEGLGTVNSLLLGVFMKLYEYMFSVKGVQFQVENQIRNSQRKCIGCCFVPGLYCTTCCACIPECRRGTTEDIPKFIMRLVPPLILSSDGTDLCAGSTVPGVPFSVCLHSSLIFRTQQNRKMTMLLRCSFLDSQSTG